MSILVATALLPLTSVAAHAAPAKPHCHDVSSTAEAVALAKSCGSKVEALELRTETTQLFVNPDGTSTIEQYALPQRVKQSDGVWADLDTTLRVNPDGTVSPKATIVSLKLSGGGDGDLLTATQEGKEVKLSWPGKLPRPVLDGAKATYPEVFTGVDLVVTALETGFSEVLVVKDRQAAANPKLKRLAFGSVLKGMRWEGKNNELKALDPAGKPVLRAAAPMMWDSAPGVERAVSDVKGPSDKARNAPIGVTVKANELVLTPDATMLTDPKTTFPLFIDPTFEYPTWTMINQYFPNQSYWGYDRWGCADQGWSGECAKVGYHYVGNTVRYRSMFQFPTNGYVGKTIVSTRFTIDLIHSASCDAYNWTQLRWVNGYLHENSTWNGMASSWDTWDSAAVNNQSCNQTRKLTEFAGGGLQSRIEQAAREGWTYTTWGLKAEDETNTNDWKKFDATTAKLIVIANSAPNTPSNLTVDGKPCATGANRPFVSTATPTFKAQVWDSDGDTMDVGFRALAWDYTDTPLVGDFTGDGKDDMVIYNESTGDWYVHNGTSGSFVGQWGGVAGDVPLVGDMNGDGKDDRVIYRQDGYWHVAYTGGGAGQFGGHWGGSPGDIPLIGDFNGDNKEDRMIFRRSHGGWFIAYTDGTSELHRDWWGNLTHDVPLIGDFNGDNKDDMMIYRAENNIGGWYVAYHGGAAVTLKEGWGKAGYEPVVADFNKDGKADIAYYSPSDGGWHIRHTGGSTETFEEGKVQPGGYPLTGDFNGDGRTDKMNWHGAARVWKVAYSGFTTTDLASGFGGPAAGWADRGARGQGSIANGYWAEVTSPLLSEGVHAFHAWSNDWPMQGYRGGHWQNSAASGNCEFEVDVTKPAAPGVAGEATSEGKTATFTFTGDPDVKYYKWGFSDPPSNVSTPATLGGSVSLNWTPATGGPKTLFVQAVDRAGNVSDRKDHQFYVAPPTIELTRWRLAESLYDDMNGIELTSHGATLGAPGRITGGETAAAFNGAGQYLETTDPVIADTRKSFTVSAWVKTADNTTTAHIVSQFNGSGNGFILERVGGVWKFTGPTGSQYPGAEATAGPVNVWTHLTGVYDADAQQMRLYVDGKLAATANITTSKADGSLIIGGITDRFFKGSIADVRIWDRTVSDADIATMADPTKVGEWKFEEVGPGPATDTSNMTRDLTFNGGAHVPASGAGQSGTGLRLDGTDDYVTPDAAVLHTSQSFTVSAHVRMSSYATGKYVSVMAQSTDTHASFMLYWQDHAGTGYWHLMMRHTDGTYTDVGALAPTAVGAWTHLVGVHDAQKREIKLYVNGQLKISTPVTGTVWDAVGPLQIGRAGYNGSWQAYWPGDIDEVRVYQGVVTDLTKIKDGIY